MMSICKNHLKRGIWPLSDNIPRQKAYLYVFLIFFTALLICFYSYPLETKSWTIRPVASILRSMYRDNDDISLTYYDESYLTDRNPTHQQKFYANQNKIAKTTENFGNDTSLPEKEIGKQPKNSEKTIEFLKNGALLPERDDELSKNSIKAQSMTILETATTDILTSISTANSEEKSEETNATYDNDSVKNGKIFANEDNTQHVTTTYPGDNYNNDSSTFSTIFSENLENGNTMKEAVNTADREMEITGQSTISDNIPQKSLNISQNKTSTKVISREMNTTHKGTLKSDLQKNKTTLMQDSGDARTHSATTNDFLENSISGVQKGFLVFSGNCKIPDLDPMHPSIRHLVSTTPPLDCSKDYQPLTWTEGHYLFLNETMIRERTSGENFTCCYRSVERKNDGKSDNDVGFGKECMEILHKIKIKEEFVKVECQYKNLTEFYKEFHSFIHDKPKVEQRCKNSKNTFKYSVLIIGADAVSRMNMHRQLNATAEYLLKEMKAIEMFGYNKVGDNTFPNIMPLLTGYAQQELPSVCWKSDKLPLDRCNFLWKRFSAKGYRTFYSEDAPHISSFNYVKEGFLHQPTDYYFRPFIKAYQNDLGREKHLNCYWCVGSTSETEAILHWTEEFASHFSDRPYFAFSWINSLTHDYLNTGSSGDHMFKKFFQTLHQTGSLNRTIVIFMSDHGMRWGEFRNTYVGRLEERLPMLLIALPPDFKRENIHFTKNLQLNSHRLVTPFDLHATLVQILNLGTNWTFTNVDGIEGELAENFTNRAISLFQPVPEDRSCDDAFIEEHWCTCEESFEADISSNSVKRAADFLVNRINTLLELVSHKCAHISLHLITDARLWQPPSEHKGHSIEDNIYTLVIHTKPGGAMFEGTVKISGPKEDKILLGSISRLNLYGNQSICVDNAILKKYCYCL